MEQFWQSVKDYFKNFVSDGGLTIVRTIAFALLGLVILKIVRAITRRVTMRSKLDNAAATFVISLITVVLYIVLVIVVVSSLGVSTAGIIAAFSAVALAVALALKDSLASLANGVIIIFTKPFKKGDTVMINGQEGTVQDIRLFNTKILTFNNEEVVVPNSDVLSETLINESARPLRRVELIFYINYSADANAVRAEIIEMLNRNENVVSVPAPNVVIDGFGESSVRCAAYAWAAISDYSAAKLAAKDIVYVVMRKYGAEPSVRRLNVNVGGTENAVGAENAVGNDNALGGKEDGHE